MLLELTARYAESSDLSALLHDVTRRLAQELDVSRASLVVMDGEDQGRVVAASDAPTLKDLRIDLDRYPEVRQCVRTGRPILVDDVPSHPLLEGIHAQVAAGGPLHRRGAAHLQGQVLGVPGDRRSGWPHSLGLDVLATVAHATAVASAMPTSSRRYEGLGAEKSR
jgi:GAF domain-containing protein